MIRFIYSIALLVVLGVSPAFKTIPQGDNVEFVCARKQMASNQCHYNFIVDGGKFRYVDIGCRFKKKDEVIEKVKDGSLALAKDWKINCGEVKEKKEDSGY